MVFNSLELNSVYIYITLKNASKPVSKHFNPLGHSSEKHAWLFAFFLFICTTEAILKVAKPQNRNLSFKSVPWPLPLGLTKLTLLVY